MRNQESVSAECRTLHFIAIMCVNIGDMNPDYGDQGWGYYMHNLLFGAVVFPASRDLYLM